jgi:hypothetical protein
MNGGAVIRYTKPGQWALLRVALEPGRETLRWVGKFATGRHPAERAELRWMRRDRPLGLSRIEPLPLIREASPEMSGSSPGSLSQSLTVHLPTEGPTSALVYLFLAEGSVLEKVELVASSATPEPGVAAPRP